MIKPSKNLIIFLILAILIVVVSGCVVKTPTTSSIIDNQSQISLLESDFQLVCPPSGGSVKSEWREDYVDLFLDCRDSGGVLSNHLILDSKTRKEILFYKISNNELTWHLKGEVRHSLTALEQDQGCDIHGDDCTIVIPDLQIDGKKQNTFNVPISSSYDPTVFGWLGFFSLSKFTLNNELNGGVLEVMGRQFKIDFVDNTIKEIP